MEFGLFLQAGRNRWAKQRQFPQTNPCRGFLQTLQNLGCFRKNRKLLKIDRNEGTGTLPNWRLCSSSNNLNSRFFKLSAIDVIAQAILERLYLFSGLHQFVPRGNCSYVPTPLPHARRLFLDFGAIFSQVTLIFFVNMIRQVIWPSPGTLGTHTISSENAAGRVKERAEAGGPSVANVCQPVFCHFIQQNFVGHAFLYPAGAYFRPRFAFVPPFHW